MDIKLQLITFLFSFVFGFLFYYLSLINYRLINNKKRITKLILCTIFVTDMDFIYLFFLYRINNGIFHIYFFITIVGGYYVGYKCLDFVKGIRRYCLRKIGVLK